MRARRLTIVGLLAAILGAPRAAGAATPPVIAPFFADVDTRGAGSGLVTWSSAPVTFAGRPAVCVDWSNVGYYSARDDKLNRFQLLLVDRSDVRPGDFDVVMNYDTIQWESGAASGGTDGLGGTSAAVCYSAGPSDASRASQLDGSLVSGAFLDTNGATGLTRTSRNSVTPGRHVFEVRSGAPPAGGGAVTGVVTDDAVPASPVPGAPVQICRRIDGRCLVVTVTGADGRYAAAAVPEDDYTVTAAAPAGATLASGSANGVRVAAGGTAQADVVLRSAVPPPMGVSVSPSRPGGGSIPVVYWGQPFGFSIDTCAAGAAAFTVSLAGRPLAAGAMTEDPPGTYHATVQPLRPSSGLATVTIDVTCPGGAAERVSFDVYIDPSGVVRTLDGRPIAGALVTLSRADGPNGPFEIVPAGSAVTSPMNRRNPDLTDVNGHFGWDVVAGFYVVRAEADGCRAASGAPYVESAVLAIPPEIRDLDLRLDCAASFRDALPPTTTVTLPPPGASGVHAGPVAVLLSASDDAQGAGVASVHYALTGAETGSGSAAGDRARFELAAAGETQIAYWAVDLAGNAEPAQTIVVRVEQATAPPGAPASPTSGGGCGGCGASGGATGLLSLLLAGIALRRRR